ncbi:MAG TPA: ribosome-associated translation inhibitor RaiA [Selenomonas sp.]|jgi:putative sigma-54 modulation protein|nr:ribosome-associated translation inhibitor RaiA [Selenomonas sp.]
MRYIISGKNITVTDELKEAIYKKLGKLEKFFTPDTKVYVTLSVQKQRQKIEVTIPLKGHTIRAEQESDDMYVSIDLVEEIIVRQLRKYKTRIARKSRQNLQQAFLEEEAAGEDERGISIVRTKKFAVKPLTPEDACVEMELLGHNFFVFRNIDTDEVNVVYKRKENTYGLIEPED